MDQVNKNVEIDEKETKSKQWIMGFVANALIFTYGTQTGWMSPSIVIFQSTDSPSGYTLTDYQISVLASAPCLTAVVFSMGFSYIADRYGRKIGLILVAINQAISWTLKLISADPICLIISQIIVGISWAGVFSVTPVYTKEIASDSIRGALAASGMLLQSVGIFTMYAMGAFLNYYTILWIAVWIPIVNAILLLAAPESPPYLVKVGRFEDASVTIAKLLGVDRNHKLVIKTMDDLKTSQELSDNLPSITIRNMFEDKVLRRALYLGLFMITVLDAAGNFAVFSYASVIIQNSGIKINPVLQSLSIPAVMFAGSLVSSVTVEKYGRKPLLIASLIMNGLPMIILGLVLVLISHDYALPPWIAVACVLLSVFAFGSGVLPIPYIVMTEIFTFQIRAKILGFYVSYGWFLCFLQNILFTPISQALGMHSLFMIFGGINIMFAVMCTMWMPETKGKCLEDIQKKLAK